MKRGFTVVELIVSFSLALVIAVFLFQITFNLKNLYEKSTIKTELLNIQALISREINNKLKNNDIQTVLNCGTYCLNFIYANGENDNLILDYNNKTIQFGTYKVELPKNSYFEAATIGSSYSGTFSDNSNNAMMIINIPIYNEKIEDQNFGVNIVYQYNTNENDIFLGEGVQKNAEYGYTGKEQKFVAAQSGYYKLETWGAQGGTANTSYYGGAGGYSTGMVYLEKGQTLYINVGGQGISKKGNNQVIPGGYNGGGSTISTNYNEKYENSSGGGATHIAYQSGLLSELKDNKESILLVAAGGGGGSYWDGYFRGNGGAGGGEKGSDAVFIADSSSYYTYGTGATQTAGGHCIAGASYNLGLFGTAATNQYISNVNAGATGGGGGGGYYGGGGGCQAGQGGGGGSSFFGDVLDGKTISGTEKMPTHDGQGTMTGNSGNGYAKIIYIGKENEGQLFDYTGSEQTYAVLKSGYYKLETWGAQGGAAGTSYYGGYGGYSTGTVYLTEGQTLYINVGGQGSTASSGSVNGGYNGGGSASTKSNYRTGSGGGATHISTTSGLLSTLSNKKDSILIVSGGGGGANYDYGTIGWCGDGGASGGYVAPNSTIHSESIGGSQTSGGLGAGFGYGGGNTSGIYCGGGSGLYGGGIPKGDNSPCAGGSSYIGNSLLTNKSMYCYNCSTSTDPSTLTYSTTNVSEIALSNYVKKGNGYAKITYIGE